MSEHVKPLEVQGEDVETAIAEGLSKLGLGRSEVEIEVLEEGRRGFLGIGGREALVRLTPRESVAAVSAEDATTSRQYDETGSVLTPEKPLVAEAEVVATASVPADRAPDEQELVALEVVRDLLRHMQVDATVEVSHSDPDDLTGRQMLILDVRGDDLGALIGSRGEALNDFQYIARLMTGHRLHRRADFLIDVDGYRQRRQTALTQLARRMARKATKRGRPVTLEPMSPYDRRVIHITLRDDDSVYTESTGQGNRRRVRIYPK